MLRFITDKAVCEGSLDILFQQMPGLEQRLVKRLPVKTVNQGFINRFPFCSRITYNQHIMIGCLEQIRRTTRYCNLLDQ